MEVEWSRVENHSNEEQIPVLANSSGTRQCHVYQTYANETWIRWW